MEFGAPRLSRRARLTLEVLRAMRAGHPPTWVQPLAVIRQPVPQELLVGARAISRNAVPGRHPLRGRRWLCNTSRQWWSGGPALFSAATPQSDGFFRTLFEAIRDTPVLVAPSDRECELAAAAVAHHHVLSMTDLFHGHMFSIGSQFRSAHVARKGLGDKNGAGRQENSVLRELGCVFHAKEYPIDLSLQQKGNRQKKNGSTCFDTQHPAYRARNLVWISSTNTIYVWRPPLHTKWEALLQLGAEWPSMNSELRAVLLVEHGGTAPHRLAYTLSEAGFRELASNDQDDWECDVNLDLRVGAAVPMAVLFAWTDTSADRARL